MKVIYRMCGIPSTNPSPWSQEDKDHLNRTCLRSFTEAFKDVRPKMYFICDFCDERKYIDILNECPFERTVEFTELGINATMNKSYDLATKSNDYVLFQECDYLYRPNTGKLMESSIKKLGLVSPYDHLNFYIDRSIHSESCMIELVDGNHFRTTERNTMTWGCDADLVRENYDMLTKYGYLDDDVWTELLYSGHRLWVPIPSIATHCVNDYLAPGINWENLWKKYQ